MKNVTVSIDDETYRQARIKAAEKSTSISSLFKEFLIRLTTNSETEFDRLEREELELREEMRAQHLGLQAAQNISREKLYD